MAYSNALIYHLGVIITAVGTTESVIYCFSKVFIVQGHSTHIKTWELTVWEGVLSKDDCRASSTRQSLNPCFMYAEIPQSTLYCELRVLLSSYEGVSTCAGFHDLTRPFTSWHYASRHTITHSCKTSKTFHVSHTLTCQDDNRTVLFTNPNTLRDKWEGSENLQKVRVCLSISYYSVSALYIPFTALK